jgi:hypothetical protein
MKVHSCAYVPFHKIKLIPSDYITKLINLYEQNRLQILKSKDTEHTCVTPFLTPVSTEYAGENITAY